MKGKLTEIMPTVQVSDNFKKRTFVLNDMNSEYPQEILFQLNQDRVELLDALKIGDMVEVQYNLKGKRWEKDGKVFPSYTQGGHRRYNRVDIEKLAGIYIEPEKFSCGNRVALYCRVSSHDQKQKGDLERQVGRITSEAIKRKYQIVEVFEEVGSGMNDNRGKLKNLCKLVENKDIDIVLIEHKDRLSRFCINYLIQYFNSYNVKIEWVNESIGSSYEQELVDDILSLMASFSARIYGRRSHQNRAKQK
jgi:predicted site-specific integrase-resolvase